MVNIVTGRHEWAIENRASSGAQATTTRAADPGGRHICKSITAAIGGPTGSGLEVVVLRDGATGAGTILWSCILDAGAIDTKLVFLSDLNIVGSKNTAMTLEFIAGGEANSFESVAMSGYTETDVVQRTG